MVEIQKEDKDGVHLIKVAGDVDAGSSIHLDNAFKEAIEKGAKKIAVDLNELHYISSAGLGVFISHLDEMKIHSISLSLFGIQEAVKQVFDILGLEKLIDIQEDEAKAFEALNG